MVDLMCALDPGFDFAIACRLEGLRRSVITTARKIRAMM
jgi:hypothetical protein